MKRSIVFTSNNFQIGGRETFVLSHIPLLKRDDTTAHLLANNATGYDPKSVFDSIALIPRGASGEIPRWVECGAKLITKNAVELIWSQHFRLLPAWVMAQMLGVPFLATFHSPNIVMPGSKDPIESLGATLALCRSGLLTAVSEEVREKILDFNICANVKLIENRVAVPEASVPLPRQSQVRVVLLARGEKLEHIRQGVRLFHQLRNQAGDAHLTIYSCHPSENKFSDQSVVSQMGTTARKLGRKWLLKNKYLLRDLPSIEFRPYIDEPAQAIQHAHVVFGMGRVVLEGLSMGRPSVLIGYNEVVGLVTEQRWSKYAASNFSGRGIAGTPLAQVAADVLKALKNAPQLTQRLRTLLDIEVAWPKTSAILVSAKRSRIKPCNKELAQAISRIFMSSTCDVTTVQAAVQLLNSEEQAVYTRLMQS